MQCLKSNLCPNSKARPSSNILRNDSKESKCHLQLIGSLSNQQFYDLRPKCGLRNYPIKRIESWLQIVPTGSWPDQHVLGASGPVLDAWAGRADAALQRHGRHEPAHRGRSRRAVPGSRQQVGWRSRVVLTKWMFGHNCICKFWLLQRCHRDQSACHKYWYWQSLQRSHQTFSVATKLWCLYSLTNWILCHF